MLFEKVSLQGRADAMKGDLCEIKPSFSLKKITLMPRYVFSALKMSAACPKPGLTRKPQKVAKTVGKNTHDE